MRDDRLRAESDLGRPTQPGCAVVCLAQQLPPGIAFASVEGSCARDNNGRREGGTERVLDGDGGQRSIVLSFPVGGLQSEVFWQQQQRRWALGQVGAGQCWLHLHTLMLTLDHYY